MPFDIDQWRYDHWDDPIGHPRSLVALKVPHGSRVLASDGDVATEAWRLATDGLAENGTAYLFADDGWHWAAVVDGSERGQDGAYLLQIAPDGRQFAERYTDRDEAYSDLEHYTERATSEHEALRPADFAQFLRMTAPGRADELALAVTVAPSIEEANEPPPVITGPLAWVAAAAAPKWWEIEPIGGWQVGAPTMPEPAPVLTAAPLPVAEEEPAPMVPDQVADPVAALPVARRGLRQWIRDQARAIIGPWLAEERPTLQLPRLIKLDLTPAEAD